MQNFQTKDEPSQMHVQSILGEILGFPGSQQRNRREPGQSYGHSNHETSSHSKGVEEFLWEGLIYLKIHSWIGINYFYFWQIIQEGTKLRVRRSTTDGLQKVTANYDEPSYCASLNPQEAIIALPSHQPVCHRCMIA